MQIRSLCGFFLTWVGSYEHHCFGINAHTFLFQVGHPTVWPCIVSVYYFPGLYSPLTEDTSMIIVSSCVIKLQEVLSGLVKKAKTLDIHMHFNLWLFSTFIHSFITLLFFSFQHVCVAVTTLALYQKAHVEWC